MTPPRESLLAAGPAERAAERSAERAPPSAGAESRSRRALLIWNRNSRKGRAHTAPVLETLMQGGLEIVRHHPSSSRHIAEVIRARRADVDAVILGGGDGTMSAAAGALMETGLPLGILPTGTANDLARTLQIPLDLEEACRVIAAGHVQRVDLGCVNGVHFFNAASLGVGAGVTRRLRRETKGRWGVLAYPLSLYDVVKATRSFAAEVSCDGETEVLRSIHVTVGNGRHYGGGMTLAEDAAIDDSCLDMYSIRPQSFWRLLRLAPQLRMGSHGDSDAIDVRRAREIEIRTRKSKSISTDGELTTRTPARFSVMREAVSIYAPEPAS